MVLFRKINMWVLDFQAGVNEISPKGGGTLGACIAKFKTWKDVGIIAYHQSFNYNINLYP